MLRRMSKRQSLFNRWYGAAKSRQTRNMGVKHLDQPDKSEGDPKHYRSLSLQNGLRAMLISDPKMSESSSSSFVDSSSRASTTSSTSLEQYHGKLAACAVLMGVGSFYEPKKYQGLAHFLEHMIFMGSKKYPEENAFDSFVTKSGGFSNAHTENEDTCFYFEVEEQHLDKTMDMFMNLMKAPLMSADSMTRERSAVQSEFEQSNMVDGVRRDQVLATLAGEGFPHSTFSWGNLKSLQENVNDLELHKELHDFQRKHYGSNRMIVCLQATLPLDELENLLVRHCSDIPKSQMPPLDMSSFDYRNAFKETFFRDVLLVQPVEDVCKLELTWVLPSMRTFYRVKPAEFLSHLLGYEGVGSLCSYLRRRLWCMSILAGVGSGSFDTNSIYSLFTLSIYLTDEGFGHLDEVIAATFAWIRMLCSYTTLLPTYKEVQQIADTNFRFQIELPSMDNVQSIAEALRFLPPKDVLTGTQLYFEYDDTVVKMTQKYLSEFRFNIMISSHIPFAQYKYDRREPWFGTHYALISMPEKWKKMWTSPEPHPELKFPEKNPFVTTDFTLQWVKAGNPHISRRPKALIRNDLCELWFRQDDTFLLPDGYINMYLITPVMRESVENFMAAVLFTYLVEFYIAEQLYPALTAGLTYGLDAADKGLVLRASGYNEKLPLLFEIILDVMKRLEINTAQVMSFKELKKRQIFNAIINAKTLNVDLRLSVMEYRRYTLLQKYEALKSITAEDIERFKNTFYKQMYVQALIQGNFSEDHARQVTQNVLNTFKSAKVENLEEQHNRIVQLPHGEYFLRVKTLNEDDTNTIVTNYHQVGPSSLKVECILELLDLITEEPFFNQLRTKEQLCYSLGIYQRIAYGIQGYMLTINTQETKVKADFVEQRLETFRLSVPQIVENLTQEEYEQFRGSLINMKKLGDTSLDDEVMRNWSEIVSLDYFFNRTEMQIAALNTIEKKDILEFISVNANTNMRKLSVQVIGSSAGTRRSQSDLSSSGQSSISSHTPRPGSLAVLLTEVQRTISDEQLLFEQIGNKIKLHFIGDPTNPSHILDIAQFKKDLHVFPRISLNPKLKKPVQET